MEKIKLGQKLFTKELLEVEVTKIGNKYFYIDNDSRYNYDLISLEYRHKDYSQFTRKLFLDRQVILDQREFDLLEGYIRNIFRGYGKLNVSLDKLRKIKLILMES